MYTETNFKTKKAFKEAFANGTKITVYQPGGIFPGTITGIDSIEGPHYPDAHKWYARVEIKDQIVTRILG